MPIKSVVLSVAHAVPERVVTNDELAELMTTSDEWIRTRTGIEERRFIASPDVSTCDLGEQAAREALSRATIPASSIDLIVASTLSPDYYFPGIGTMLQSRLDMPHIGALDIRAQCSGLVYGLATADAFIRSGQATRVLLVCAEVQSPVLEFNDRGRDMAVLFGDGAGALVLEAVECDELPTLHNRERGIIDSVLHSNGKGAEMLCVKAPGTGLPGFLTESAYKEGLWHPQMDGRSVFKHAVTGMCEASLSLLERNQGNASQIDLLIPHQANMRINEAVREKLQIPESKVVNTIQKYGNTTSATIPISMSEAEANGRLQQESLVMTLAFGAGFTWGGNLVRW